MPEPSSRVTRATAGVIDPNPAGRFIVALNQAEKDSKQEKEAALVKIREQRKSRREEEKAAREKAKADAIMAEEVRIKVHKKELSSFEEVLRKDEGLARADAVNPAIPTFANAAVVPQAVFTCECSARIQCCGTDIPSSIHQLTTWTMQTLT